MKNHFLVMLAALLLPFAVSVQAQVTSNTIYNGLVSYWPMDQFNTNGSTVTTPDIVSGINLTAVAGPAATAGRFGNGILLNGTSQYLVNTNTSSAGSLTNNLATGLPYAAGTPFTVAFWIKGNAPTSVNHYIFTMGNTTNVTPLYALQSGSAVATESNLDVIIRQLNSTPPVNHASTTNILFDGNWHHLAWVDSNGVVSVYQDGILETNPAGAFSYFPDTLISPNAVNSAGANLLTEPLNTTAFGALVRSSVAGYLAASFDDAAVWNRALSQAEVQYVMSNSITGPVPALSPSFGKALPATANSAMGDYVVLSANAAGTPPLALQWYENGSPILNATNQNLSLYNLTTPGTNILYVTASNPSGTVTNGPLSLAVQADAAPQLSVSCFGYWPMDAINGSGSNVTTPDVYQGNNFNLNSAMNSGNLVAGEFTNAISFNNTTGNTNYGYLDGVVPAFNYTNYTVSFWVNAPANTAQTSDTAFGNTSSTTGTPLFLLGYADTTAATNSLCVYLRSDQGQAQLPYVVSASPVFDGTWHHVTWVDKAGSVTLYVDGAIDPVNFSYIRTNSTPTLRSNQTWSLTSESLSGRWVGQSSSFRMTCSLDDVAWWSRALSYTEVQALQTNPLPPPTVVVAPVIATQPAQATNAYVGDTVNFSVALSAGSPPLTYSWLLGGVAINTNLNPSAATATLSLTNVHPSNNGFYSVTISNGAAPGSGFVGGGVTTSSNAQLIVSSYVPTTGTNTQLLQLEFNAVSAPSFVQPGWQSFTLAGNPQFFSNALKVTLSPISGGVMADRSRNGGSPSVSNNPPALNTALIYNSFIFDNSIAAGSGLQILIQHLAPNTPYGLNLWSFDPQSPTTRISDWVEVTSGTVISNLYDFNGSMQPTADWQDIMGAVLISDPTGQLQIQGTMDPLFASQLGVFINALTLTVNPVPAITSVTVGADKNLFVTAQAQYVGQPLTIQESTDLIHWQDATDAVTSSQTGPVLTAEFPISRGTAEFYRVIYEAH